MFDRNSIRQGSIYVERQHIHHIIEKKIQKQVVILK